MAAGKLDLNIDKGATFRKTLYYKDKQRNAIDLTGYTARMQVKTSTRSSTTVLDLTTENGGITLTPLDGQIDIYVSDEDTSAITHQGTAVYDLELEDAGGDVIKLVRGTVAFHEEVTT